MAGRKFKYHVGDRKVPVRGNYRDTIGTIISVTPSATQRRIYRVRFPDGHESNFGASELKEPKT